MRETGPHPEPPPKPPLFRRALASVGKARDRAGGLVNTATRKGLDTALDSLNRASGAGRRVASSGAETVANTARAAKEKGKENYEAIIASFRSERGKLLIKLILAIVDSEGMDALPFYLGAKEMGEATIGRDLTKGKINFLGRTGRFIQGSARIAGDLIRPKSWNVIKHGNTLRKFWPIFVKENPELLLEVAKHFEPTHPNIAKKIRESVARLKK